MDRLEEIIARIEAFDALSPAEMGEETCPAAEAFWDMVEYDLRWCVEELAKLKRGVCGVCKMEHYYVEGE